MCCGFSPVPVGQVTARHTINGINICCSCRNLIRSFRLNILLTTQVTLPALKDSIHIAAVTLFVVVLAVTSLPVLLTAERDAKSAGAATVIRYAVGATAVCLSLSSVVTFLFVPKVRQTAVSSTAYIILT